MYIVSLFSVAACHLCRYTLDQGAIRADNQEMEEDNQRIADQDQQVADLCLFPSIVNIGCQNQGRNDHNQDSGTDDSILDQESDDSFLDLAAELIQDLADHLNQDPADNLIQEPADNLIQDPADNLIQEPADNLIQDPADNLIQDPADNLIQDQADDRRQDQGSAYDPLSIGKHSIRKYTCLMIVDRNILGGSLICFSLVYSQCKSFTNRIQRTIIRKRTPLTRNNPRTTWTTNQPWIPQMSMTSSKPWTPRDHPSGNEDAHPPYNNWMPTLDPPDPLGLGGNHPGSRRTSLFQLTSLDQLLESSLLSTVVLAFSQ